MKCPKCGADITEYERWDMLTKKLVDITYYCLRCDYNEKITQKEDN